MDIVAQKKVEGQEEERFQSIQDSLQDIKPEKFWEELGEIIREGIRVALEKAIHYEFSQFIGALEYENPKSQGSSKWLQDKEFRDSLWTPGGYKNPQGKM